MKKRGGLKKDKDKKEKSRRRFLKRKSLERIKKTKKDMTPICYSFSSPPA
jgi:hypothetical protein